MFKFYLFIHFLEEENFDILEDFSKNYDANVEYNAGCN